MKDKFLVSIIHELSTPGAIVTFWAICGIAVAAVILRIAQPRERQFREGGVKVPPGRPEHRKPSLERSGSVQLSAEPLKLPAPRSSQNEKKG